MQSFVLEAQTLTPTPRKKTNEDDSSSELIEQDMNVPLKGLEELNFDHPQIKKKVLQSSYKSWPNAQPTQTRAMKRKRLELPTYGLEGEPFIK